MILYSIGKFVQTVPSPAWHCKMLRIINFKLENVLTLIWQFIIIIFKINFAF